KLHFDQIAGAEIVYAAHRADGFARAVMDAQTDEIGVVELPRVGFRQRGAGHVKMLPLQGLGRVAVANPAERRDDLIGPQRTQRYYLKPAPILGQQRPVAAEPFRSRRKGLHLHLALDAVRSGDHADENAALRQAGTWPAAAALAAAAARSCAFFLGFIFSGLW